MSGLIIFLHGLRGDSTHWTGVPTYVESSLSSFTTTRLDYSADALGHADLETSADQILTKMHTDFLLYDPIFIVGYSMGGLVAREVCVKLLQSVDDETKLLERILGVITFGSPLSGLRPSWRGWSVNKVKSFLTPKVRQLTAEFVFDRYNKAVKSAFERGINGPKQIHYEIENDELVDKHDTRAYTRDDLHAGTISGTHGGFLNSKDAQKEVADRLLAEIQQRYNSLGSAGRAAITEPSSYSVADRILLIACSNRKITGGNKSFNGPPPAGWIPQPELRDQIKSKRNAVLSLLRGFKLTSGYSRASNRMHQAPNKILKHGPDFGGVEEGGAYMPAWQRYVGRCYAPIREVSWENHFRQPDQLCVLIMSGLYGWLDAAEWIQEYDVHLADFNNDNGIAVSAMWTELFTQTLIAYVNSAYKDKKVHVYNFLCDEVYINAVHWHKLPSTCSVYHLASPGLESGDLLPVAGTLIDLLLRKPGALDNVERCTRDTWKVHPLTDYGLPPEDYLEARILFEATVGEARKNPNFPST
jgi:pimeloyl-ACP methyl ester carboxylesterase